VKHEKIIRREDGSRVKITVELVCEWFRSEPLWTFICHRCGPNKRTWTTPVNHDDYSWRGLSSEDRDKEDRRRSLLLASEDEVLQVMRELLAKIEPKV